MRTILKLTPLLVAGAAFAAPQPAANPASRPSNAAPPAAAINQDALAKPLGPAGACPPGYAQDQKAVHDAVAAYTDPGQRERAIAAIPCVRIAARSTNPDPTSARVAPAPPTDKPPR